jgi:hypothetical protein
MHNCSTNDLTLECILNIAYSSGELWKYPLTYGLRYFSIHWGQSQRPGIYMRRPENKQYVGRPYKTNFARNSPLQVSTLSSTQVLQRIREMLFTDIFKKRSSPIVCVDHVHLLQSSLGLEIDKIVVPCCKVWKDLEKP